MDMPAVEYYRTNDGYSLAYWDIGEGRPVVLVPSRLNSLRQVWTSFGPWFRPLMEGNRFISFDARGQGLSTRGLRSDISVQHYVDDLAAVLDHIGLDKIILFGQGFGGHVATLYAAAHPERTQAMVLATVTVEIRAWNLPFWSGVAGENWELFLRSLAPRSLSEDGLREWLDNVKQIETHEDYMLAARASGSSSIADVLPLLRAPTLVMHPRNYVMVAEEEGTRLAAAIPNARLVVLNSNENFLGDPGEFVATATAFINSVQADETAAPAEVAMLPVGLSPREREVLRLIAQGLSNQQLADELVISVRTVERHINHIYEKLGIHNRAQAAAYALRARLD
ncbi:MAG TPA: alpha/beta fold hydrolase [Dehalococcoidia bacterium]|nr:alpha/beta fold hydrolase [Dehalococcoidia bacterium]